MAIFQKGCLFFSITHDAWNHKSCLWSIPRSLAEPANRTKKDQVHVDVRAHDAETVALQPAAHQESWIMIALWRAKTRCERYCWSRRWTAAGHEECIDLHGDMLTHTGEAVGWQPTVYQESMLVPWCSNTRCWKCRLATYSSSCMHHVHHRWPTFWSPSLAIALPSWMHALHFDMQTHTHKHTLLKL